MKRIMKRILMFLVYCSIIVFIVTLLLPFKEFILEEKSFIKNITSFIVVSLSLLISYTLVRFISNRGYAWYKKNRQNVKSGFNFYNNYFEYRDYKYSGNRTFKKYRWSDVEKIFLFKRCLLNLDQIGISMKLSNNEEVFVTEDVDGWREFLIEIDNQYPNINIMEEVMIISTPPLEEKGKVIFDKQLR